MQKKFKIILGLIIFTLLVIVFSFRVPKENLTNSIVVIPNSYSVSIVVGAERYDVPVTSGETLYQVLISAKKNKLVAIDGNSYPLLGFFVTQIGNLKSGGGKNLFFYVNKEESSVGVSSYRPKEGDVVEWRLK